MSKCQMRSLQATEQGGLTYVGWRQDSWAWKKL